MIKRIVLLSVAGFFCAVLAVAFHYHDTAFSLPSCSICKVKTTAGTMTKIKIASAPAVAVVSLDLAAVFTFSAAAVRENAALFISSPIGDLYPNKAPPVRS